MKRRNFIKSAAVVGASIPTLNVLGSVNTLQPSHEPKGKGMIIGHGDFTYRLRKDWINPDAFKVKDCHEMVMDKQGRLILLTNETSNNIVILDRSGKVKKTWGNEFPGGHGLTLHNEGGDEFLYITDQDRNQVFKTNLDGKVLMTLDYPKESGAYEKQEQYKPTETAIGPNGDIYVADGYGSSYVIQYNAKGEYIRHFGGKGETKVLADDKFDCAHGVCIDDRDTNNPTLLITSRSSKEVKRFTLDGKWIETIKLANCWICRPVVKGENLYFACIVSKSWWSYDGFVMVLDKNNKVVSAPGGSAPKYKDGRLMDINYENAFLNPHDVCIDGDENIYVPQWFSGKTMPYMLERV